MSIAAVGLVFALASPPADVTGKWEGKISASDGSGQEDTALLILTQKDAWATRGYVVGGYPGVWTTAAVPTPIGLTVVAGIEYAPLTYVAAPGWRTSLMLRRPLVIPLGFLKGFGAPAAAAPAR